MNTVYLSGKLEKPPIELATRKRAWAITLSVENLTEIPVVFIGEDNRKAFENFDRGTEIEVVGFLERAPGTNYASGYDFCYVMADKISVIKPVRAIAVISKLAELYKDEEI